MHPCLYQFANSLTHTVTKSMKQPINRSINQSINQSVFHWIILTLNKSFTRSFIHLLIQPPTYSTNHLLVHVFKYFNHGHIQLTHLVSLTHVSTTPIASRDIAKSLLCAPFIMWHSPFYFKQANAQLSTLMGTFFRLNLKLTKKIKGFS